MYIITGTSSGIGRALAMHFLNKGEKVIGLSRTNSIEHPSFHFIHCDLSNEEHLAKLDLRAYVKGETTITLINNAGITGSIERTPEVDLAHYMKVAMINIVAVQYLCTYLLQIVPIEHVKQIINISSGAGRRPIASWGAYCSSKAAVDLFSETLQEELRELKAPTKVYSLAPGVVDTNMQEVIRNSNEKAFSSHHQFIALKENNELRSPKEVAELLDELLSAKTEHEVICRI